MSALLLEIRDDNGQLRLIVEGADLLMARLYTTSSRISHIVISSQRQMEGLQRLLDTSIDAEFPDDLLRADEEFPARHS